ncbi:MAG: hypothetical protein C5B48_12540 [Candidatus Rokuibacteriota bacterium]|nr:MAG: hypothetical protein C5B48_12540 [Candidatus Rokubacteria bacterium]
MQRAFVVQFRETPKASRRVWQGRVEHIASGRSAIFANRSELLAFLGLAMSNGATDDDPQR